MAEVVSLKADGAPSPLIVEEAGGILRLTLNSPPANALSIAMMDALHGEILRAGSDKAIRVVIIAARGKVFSAGHDLKELTAHRRDQDRGRAFFEETFALCTQLMLSITRCPKPVIAEVEGLATAAGCQLVATCDLAICTDTASFCTPGVNIGLFCSTPMVAVSRAAHRKQAMEMLLTGETIDAANAKDFGLVNRIVPKQYLRQIVDKYAAVIASKSPLTLKIGKEAFYRQIDMPLEDAYTYAGRVMTENMLARDAEEGIGAFLDKRHAEWTGE
jgi:enoyl-CoA hydratase/carnithine racemase